MQIKIKLELLKILNLEFELSSGKKQEDKENVKKELPATVTTPNK